MLDNEFYASLDEQLAGVHSDMEELLDVKRTKWDELSAKKQEGDYGEELSEIITDLETILESLDSARDTVQAALEDEKKKG